MPLLDPTPQTPPSEYTIRANDLRNLPSRQFRELLTSWQMGIDRLWACDNTKAVLDDLGTDAAELFDHSIATVAFLESRVPGCTASYLAMVRPFQVNPDGTVTLVEEWPV
jgi:hypothetical protein